MVSFIIPAYNAAKTIKRSIDSILNQANTDVEYEIIIIDDGSTDNLRNIIKEYDSADSKRIKYFKKENGGVAAARNCGIEKAQGDYIIFVDSDDYISKTLLKDIKKYLKRNIDLIKWNPIWVEKDNAEIKKNHSKELTSVNNCEETTGADGFNKLFGKDPLIDCLWNYAIKKDIMLKFPEGTYHEDFATMPLIMLRAKTMIITDKYEYYYVQTDTSIMRGNDEQKQRKKLQDIVNHFDNLIQKSNEMNISKKTKENVGIFAANSLLVIVNDLEGENKDYFQKELKKRKIYKYIKIRNLKQLIKKVLLRIKY